MTSPKTPEVVKKQLNIGPYEVHAIPTGIFGLDGGSMFGTVPKVLWEKTNPPDEKNRIAMEARALLIKSNGRNILIDTGNGSDFVAKYGEKLGSKFAEMYAVDENGPNLISSLKSHGLNPGDITDVILTHLHFDHAGGATSAASGKIAPTFPNARYYLQKSNLETAKNPNVREKASYFQANFQPLIDAGVLTYIDGNTKNFLPHISVIVSNGHTQGHQVVHVEDGQKQLFYCGDVIPTSSHIRSAWIMGYDLNPLEIIREKGELLKLSQSKETYFFFEHDPYCDMANVEKLNDDYKVKERFFLT